MALIRKVLVLLHMTLTGTYSLVHFVVFHHGVIMMKFYL